MASDFKMKIRIIGTAVVGAVVLGAFSIGNAQQSPAASATPQTFASADRGVRTIPQLVIKQDWNWMRQPGVTAQVPVLQASHATDQIEVLVYGTDAKNLLISGAAGNPVNPVNLWTGLTTAPVAATVRDKSNFLDLTGLAKLHWVVRTSGFHVVRPVVKLADGTLLVADYAVSSTTTFQEGEASFTGMRWIKLDPERVVTKGAYGPDGEASAWYDKPDLSKVDEVGFADLMPGSGHGSGGWINVSRFEVYGNAVKR